MASPCAPAMEVLRHPHSTVPWSLSAAIKPCCTLMEKTLKLTPSSRFKLTPRSGPVRVLIENKFVFEKFQEYNRGEIEDYLPAFNKSIGTALNCLSKENIEGLLEIVLERLYTLRNQLIHGGATFNSKLNRSQLKDACNIMQLLVPIIIDIMLDNGEHDWGEIAYPVVK